MQVTGVLRYMNDPSFSSVRIPRSGGRSDGSDSDENDGNIITNSGCSSSDLFDLVLTNGRDTVKVLLIPSCNFLVQSNKVCSFYLVPFAYCKVDCIVAWWHAGFVASGPGFKSHSGHLSHCVIHVSR